MLWLKMSLNWIQNFRQSSCLLDFIISFYSIIICSTYYIFFFIGALHRYRYQKSKIFVRKFVTLLWIISTVSSNLQIVTFNQFFPHHYLQMRIYSGYVCDYTKIYVEYFENVIDFVFQIDIAVPCSRLNCKLNKFCKCSCYKLFYRFDHFFVPFNRFIDSFLNEYTNTHTKKVCKGYI